MNFKIVIPSLSRPIVLCQKTLKVCKECHIPLDKIYVFIIEQEKSSYISEIEKHGFQGIHVIASTPLGLDKARNYITDYFDEAEWLLHMDDDIDGIFKLYIDENIQDTEKSARYKLIEFTDIIELCNNTFESCQKENIGLFGIYPVKNGFFMKDLPEMTYDLRFCVGTLWGCINDKSIKISIEEKEDFERTLLYYKKYGKILRLNTITIKTRYYKTPGGMQNETVNRIESSKISCKYLLETYPEYTKLYTGKKTGIWEVKLVKLSATGF